MSIRIKFCGAAGTVTGACFHVTHPGGKFLVDCGMFQGPKTLKALNYGAFPFDPRTLDFVLLTHAHIDHSGLVPKLMRQGFAGPVHATTGTRDLLSFMLPDSGYIQEREVEYLNRRNAQRGYPRVSPIYTRADAEAAMAALQGVEYERWIEVGTGVRARWWNAGHILGSASIEVEVATAQGDQRILRLLFSGDIGPDNKLFHPDPEAPEGLDYVICESTYGGRMREEPTPAARRALLAEEVNRALKNKGLLLMPTFAVERTQELLADLLAGMESGAIRRAPVFLDSPLAIKATEVFAAHAEDFDDTRSFGDVLTTPYIRFTEDVEDSKAIARHNSGVVIMAASGMCEAGRIRHHLKRYLWQKNATVLITGYQAPGTLGRLLADGARAVRIQGEEIQVNATIRQIDTYSGHADGRQLLKWIEARQPIKRALFLVHGEENALASLQEDATTAGIPADRVLVPQLDDAYDLLGERAGPHLRAGPRRLPPEALGGSDWHNDLARFSLDLRATLEGARTDKQRQILLRRLRRALAGNG